MHQVQERGECAVSKAKAIGTKFESAVKRYVLSEGFEARRVALAGSDDEGDVEIGTPRFDVTIECKSRKSMQAQWISDLLSEATSESEHAGTSFGAAVVHRKGHGEKSMEKQVVMMELGDFIELLRWAS